MQPKIPKDPNFSKGVNLSGLDPSAILSSFNQVFIGNGSQKILLSKDSAGSSALADVKHTASSGILSSNGQTSAQLQKSGAPQAAAAAKAAGKSGGLPAWAKYAGIAAGGLIVLGGVAFIVLRK